jgi:Dyp-type peroxidase family
MEKVEKVEWHDVQGLVESGFANLQYAAYVLWHFGPGPVEARKTWIRGLADRLIRVDDLDTAVAPPHRPRSISRLKARIKEAKASCDETKNVESHSTAINVALTASALRALGVERDELAQFSFEFREGMAPRPAAGLEFARRSNVLGDTGDDSPAKWKWGGWNGPNSYEMIDGVLLLYASSKTTLDRLIKEEISAMGDASTKVSTLFGWLDGNTKVGFKEHFGFRDGISQPLIEGTADADGLTRTEKEISVVKPGEFVLGYLNERDARISFAHSTAHGVRDLGRNGTYLVFRQLEQNVEEFNRFLSETAKLVRGGIGLDAGNPEEWVAARLVGRDRSGEPLIPAATDSSGPAETRNDFLYHLEDRFGLACPIGAHIRRANPRDVLGPNPETALRLSKMHRIIRRGRIYGEKWPSAGAEGTKSEQADGRGLHFICLNADIAGQFEMIQHTWLNGTSFNGLYRETDPMSHYCPSDNTMTFQHRPTNLRFSVPKFVTVRGGGYFFLPGITALQSLAQ